MLIRGAEVAGRGRVDVRCAHGRIVEIGATVARAGAEAVVEAHGGALLPGLHDHHIHLMALAAARCSIPCGPPDVNDERELRDALGKVNARAAPGAWLRGVGYHESVAGELDRDVLDGFVADAPLRIQHRTGAAWFLNSRGCKRVGLDTGPDAPAVPEVPDVSGVERDASGRATGRLFRLDAWLTNRTAGDPDVPLGPVSRELAAYGVTGVTDASYRNDRAEVDRLAAAAEAGELLQSVLLMGKPTLPAPRSAGLASGAVKLMLDERDLPAPEALQQAITDAHEDSRPVAIHCVTRVELVLACAALAAVGTRSGDRIEHASVAPPELVEQIAALGITVVTQPGFVHERGDRYLVDVDERDRPHLYRLRAFDEAGVALGAGTDAPYGSPDPWTAMRAAVERTTRAGRPLGAHEALAPERALELFTTAAGAPGGPPRTVEVGEAADLVLLREPWAVARRVLSCELVRTTIRGGRVIWEE